MEEEIYYKKSRIKSRSQYNEAAKELAESKNPLAVLTENVTVTARTDFSFRHDTCGAFMGNRTEKRLCRCFVCFHNSEKKTACKTCCMQREHGLAKETEGENGAPARFTDFEIPVSPDGSDRIGEVDLTLEYGGEKYACEFKPLWNEESLLRMIAEIVTYTTFLRKSESEYKNYKRAIVFMEGSEQDKQYSDKSYQYVKGEAIDKLLRDFQITVFRICEGEKKYVIKKLN